MGPALRGVHGAAGRGRDRARAGQRPRGRRPCCGTPRPSSTSRPVASGCPGCSARSGSCPCARPECVVDGFAHTPRRLGVLDALRRLDARGARRARRRPRHRGALALTDRDGLYGAVQFTTACGRAGIDPVLGVDLAVDVGTGGSVGGSSSGGGVAAGRSTWDGSARPDAVSHPQRPRTPVRGGAIVDPRRPRVSVLARGQVAGVAPGAGWAALCRLVTQTHLRGERGSR